MLQSFYEDFLSKSLLYFGENSGEMHSDNKKHYDALTLSLIVKVTEKIQSQCPGSKYNVKKNGQGFAQKLVGN